MLAISFPITISIAGFAFPLHALAEILAFVVGGYVYRRQRRLGGDTYSDLRRLMVLVAAAVGALLGSRLGGVLENPALFMQHYNSLAFWLGNKTVAGGFVGGLFAVEIAKTIIGENRPSGDLYVFPLLVALGIGRLGCFSMGIAEHTYGIPTHLPWGMDLGDGLLRHPLMLYELVFLGLLALILFLNEKSIALVPGLKFQIFLFSYLLFRFCIEFLKPDPVIAFGLTTLQLICGAGLAYYLVFFATKRIRHA